MKRYALISLALVFSVAAGIWFLATRPARPAFSRPPLVKHSPAEEGLHAQSPVKVPAPAESPVDREPDAAATPSTATAASNLVPQSMTPDEARSAVRLLEATADPRRTPELAPFLAHPDESVRRRALNALLLVGDEAAAPLIRSWATHAKQTEQTAWAAELESAATFLATASPDWTRPAPRTPEEVKKAWQAEGSPEERKAAKPREPNVADGEAD